MAPPAPCYVCHVSAAHVITMSAPLMCTLAKLLSGKSPGYKMVQYWTTLIICLAASQIVSVRQHNSSSRLSDKNGSCTNLMSKVSQSKKVKENQSAVSFSQRDQEVSQKHPNVCEQVAI